MPNMHSANPTISIRYVISESIFVKAYILCIFFLGKPDSFRSVAQRLDVPILGELPLVQGVSMSADGGWPFVLSSPKSVQETGGVTWKESMMRIASSAVSALNIFESNP